MFGTMPVNGSPYGGRIAPIGGGFTGLASQPSPWSSMMPSPQTLAGLMGNMNGSMGSGNIPPMNQPRMGVSGGQAGSSTPPVMTFNPMRNRFMFPSMMPSMSLMGNMGRGFGQAFGQGQAQPRMGMRPMQYNNPMERNNPRMNYGGMSQNRNDNQAI